MAENEKQEAREREAGDETPSKRQPRAGVSDVPDVIVGVDVFPVDDLIARGRDFLGQPSYVVAGALHGDTDPLSLDDARSRVKAFLDGPVTEEV